MRSEEGGAARECARHGRETEKSRKSESAIGGVRNPAGEEGEPVYNNERPDHAAGNTDEEPCR